MTQATQEKKDLPPVTPPGGHPPIDLHIEYEDLSSLVRAPRNPKGHDHAAIRASFARFGFVDPILKNSTTGRLVAGHGRLETLLQLQKAGGPPPKGIRLVDGKWLVPVIHGVGFKNDVEAESYLIADNQTTMLGGWDNNQLAQVLSDLAAQEALIGTGFNQDDLDKLIRHIDRVNKRDLVSNRVEHWVDEEGFYSVPAEIREVMETRDNILVEFSGGKDSLATLLWAVKMFPDKKVYGAYIDTGVEFPGLGAFVTRTCNSVKAIPVIIKPPKEWWSWLEEKGEWPSMIFRPCMREFIHEPFAGWGRANLSWEKTMICSGSRAEEAMVTSTKTATSKLDSFGSEMNKWFHYAPCFSAKKTTLEKVIEGSGVPVWEGYARGFVRTACWCCMGQNSLQACALEDNYPGLAKDMTRWEKILGPIKPLSRGAGGKMGVSFLDLVRAGRKRLAGDAKEAEILDSQDEQHRLQGLSAPADRF